MCWSVFDAWSGLRGSRQLMLPFMIRAIIMYASSVFTIVASSVDRCPPTPYEKRAGGVSGEMLNCVLGSGLLLVAVIGA